MLRVDPKEGLYNSFNNYFMLYSATEPHYYSNLFNIGCRLLELLKDDKWLETFDDKLDDLKRVIKPCFSSLYELENWLYTTNFSNEYFIGLRGFKCTEEWVRGQLHNLKFELSYRINEKISLIRFSRGSDIRT